METGSVRIEAWIPHGGFKLEHRKAKTPDGVVLATDWLVPAWRHDELAAVFPCVEQPCLHRVLAGCLHDQVLKLAGLYGLLTAAGKFTCADELPPEPVDTWHREIRALRNATALWDSIAAEDAASLRRLLPQHQAAKGKELVGLAREHLARRVTEKLAGGRLELIAEPDQFSLCYRPLRLIDAVWQRLAEEIAGMITCSKCPAPQCGRWFLRSAGRGDRQFCSHPCQMRAWRKGAHLISPSR
jgi:hypothetical protein